MASRARRKVSLSARSIFDMLAMMPRVRRFALLLSLAFAIGCAGTPRQALDRAAADGGPGRNALALQRFDRIAARKDASEADRLAALVGAAHACDALGDA